MNEVHKIHDKLREQDSYISRPRQALPHKLWRKRCRSRGYTGQEHGMIGIYSKKLNDCQRKYSIVKKEMLAVFSVLQHWRMWMGITVYPDSWNRIWDTGDYNKKTSKWKALLSKFNIIYIHLPGSTNIKADKLSRADILANHGLHIRGYNNVLESGSLTYPQFPNEFHINHGHTGINCPENLETSHGIIKIPKGWNT